MRQDEDGYYCAFCGQDLGADFRELIAVTNGNGLAVLLDKQCTASEAVDDTR